MTWSDEKSDRLSFLNRASYERSLSIDEENEKRVLEEEFVENAQSTKDPEATDRIAELDEKVQLLSNKLDTFILLQQDVNVKTKATVEALAQALEALALAVESHLIP